MNPKLKITFCLLPFALCLFSGCQQPQLSRPGVSTVALIEADRFPPHMVGAWINEDYGWELVFEPHGRLSNITHTIGRVQLNAGEKSTFPLIDDGTGVVVPGLWHVEYNGQSSELAVEIGLDSFNFRRSDNVVRGSSRDIFIGTMPGQGETLWQTQWISVPKYFTTTASGEYVDYELPIEEGQEDKGIIEFRKRTDLKHADD